MIVRAGREKKGRLTAAPIQSILARQQDRAVGDVELDLVEREIGERNDLGEDSLAITTCESVPSAERTPGNAKPVDALVVRGAPQKCKDCEGKTRQKARLKAAQHACSAALSALGERQWLLPLTAGARREWRRRALFT